MLLPISRFWLLNEFPGSDILRFQFIEIGTEFVTPKLAWKPGRTCTWSFSQIVKLKLTLERKKEQGQFKPDFMTVAMLYQTLQCFHILSTTDCSWDSKRVVVVDSWSLFWIGCCWHYSLKHNIKFLGWRGM